MKFVEEVVVEEFLPTVRSMLAEELRTRGLTQREVADALGISQSAVSKYAHGDVRRNELIMGDERVASRVEEIADGLATGALGDVGAVVEIEVLIRRLETRGDLLARLHEQRLPELASYEGEFRVHDPDSDVRARERVRASVRRGLHALETTSGFAGLIPAVGSNVVECLPDAESVDDVAGVPGRIVDVKGQATIPGDPEFGVSGHVARVLLAARAAGSDAQAALNIRYDRELIEVLEAEGNQTAEFDGEREDLEPAVESALADAGPITVLSQPGAYGIEAISYLLAEDAEATVELARTVVN